MKITFLCLLIVKLSKCYIFEKLNDASWTSFPDWIIQLLDSKQKFIYAGAFQTRKTVDQKKGLQGQVV